ncbi:NAD-dependent epimerase/dehydratase family protein [Halorientalis salina]|uniref:NAD-dependent epimerase/dehydratase family protein n=1 Tax=Halorientalis salina TaxID=2932266 RepID=UPI00145DBF2F|nr:NAD-dependent epimerase/dehydratase family protein [Halorientalis salina]
MDIAVFGASGFVGRNLLDELADTQHRVLACDIEQIDHDASNVEYRDVDITDEQAVEDAVGDADAIAHLAAHPLPASTDDPKLNAEINVVGTLNILDAAREHDVEKVFFSSASSLVGEVETVPVPEDHPASPQSPYGVAKHAVEEYLEVYNQLYDLDYLVFRFFNVYGPYQYPESGALVPVVLSRLSDDKGVFVTGDGQQTRDFIYVRDITSFIVEGLESDVKNEVVNMGRGTDTAILDAIELMADVVGVDPDIDRKPERPDEIDDFYADTSKCERLFGRTPDTEFRDGLERTFQWLTEDTDQ